MESAEQLALELSDPEKRENANQTDSSRVSEMESAEQLALALSDPEKRENAIQTDSSRVSEMKSVEQLILELLDPEKRENALRGLSNMTLNRESFPELAPILWYSSGTIAVLLQEVVSIYRSLSLSTLRAPDSRRVCNAMALFQRVALHEKTKAYFLRAGLHVYLYPFLNTDSKADLFENLRLTSIGAIGSLLLVRDTETIKFLISTGIIPPCLRTMEMGSELAKTVATATVHRILQDDFGLAHICQTEESLSAVVAALENVIQNLADNSSAKFRGYIIGCCRSLYRNNQAREVLKRRIPHMLIRRSERN